jgi:hypothetical protein
MRFFRSVSVLFLISAALGAADPFVGTWKLNVEKSDFGDSPTAKSGSTTYEATGTGYMYVAANVCGEDQVLTRPALFRYFFTDSEKLFTMLSWSYIPRTSHCRCWRSDPTREAVQHLAKLRAQRIRVRQ